jgi:hypothetical protein
MIRKPLIRLAVFLPAIALAHPGHYHPPGEDDEFDQLRADWLHVHGYFEGALAALLVTSALVFHFNKDRKVRIGAVIAFGGSLVLLAAS